VVWNENFSSLERKKMEEEVWEVGAAIFIANNISA
jgi:hypothetical protein